VLRGVPVLGTVIGCNHSAQAYLDKGRVTGKEKRDEKHGCIIRNSKKKKTGYGQLRNLGEKF